MNKPLGLLFYIGWVGNLITCLLSFGLALIYCYYLFDYLLDGKFAKLSASLIIVIYHAYVTSIAFTWLRNPKREIAFIFIFYWLFAVFVWLLAILISLADFTFIDQQ